MTRSNARSPEHVASWSELEDREPAHARADGVDLVVIRDDEDVSVLYGRCLHRGVLLGDGYAEGQNLICGVHGWDYRYDTGVSEYDNSEVLEKFTAWVEKDDDAVFVDAAEVAEWAGENPQPYEKPEDPDSAGNPDSTAIRTRRRSPTPSISRNSPRRGPRGSATMDASRRLAFPVTNSPVGTTSRY